MSQITTGEKRQTYTIRLKPSLKKSAELLAVSQEKSLSDVFEEALLAHLKRAAA